MRLPLDELRPNGTLITVNNRLAADLKGRYDRQQAGAGRSVWPSADILPWRAWLQRQYDALVDSGALALDLLSNTQERLIWEEIIAQKTRANPMLRGAAAADLARSAHALVREWQLDDERLQALASDDTQAFIDWQQAFATRLQRDGLISEAHLAEHLCHAIDDGTLPCPQQIITAGFDDLSPVQASLFDALREKGCEIGEYVGRQTDGHCQRVNVEDREQEIRLAAAWAAQKLRQTTEIRIAIVSPQISQQRQTLERVFSEILTSGDYLADSRQQALFNLSLGRSLSDHPLAAHAQIALRLLQGNIPLNDLGQLLRSPFIGGHAGEWEGRALLDVRLREQGLPTVSLSRLLFQLDHLATDDVRHCPALFERLQQLDTLRQALPGRDTPANWSGHLRAALNTLGWPGDQGLDSEEFQQTERFLRVFSELAGIGKVRARLGLGETLGLFARLLKDTIFQARSVPAPIQILGALEAAELEFDAIWLLGMEDQVWPPLPQPNPLLPGALQRDLDMPHASADRELRFAARLTARLVGGCDHIIASHAAHNEQGENRPSPLIAGWELLTPADLVPDLLHPLAALRHTDRWLPQAIPQLGSPPDSPRGGAGLIAAQARCPFSAVALFHLDARPLPEATHSIDPALAGTLVHELLQRVWQTIAHSTRLMEMDRQAMQALVAPLAEATLAELGRRRPDLFTPAFQRIEGDRLTALVCEWLRCEQQRKQAFEIVALERQEILQIGKLALKTRADRIDRLADGSLAVIDYKTGRQVRTQGWFDERLSEPQLPLYCIGESGGEVQAALLARVRRGRPGEGCSFVGVSRSPDFAPGVSTPETHYEDTDWPRLLDHWRAAVEQLSAEISAGEAQPTPSPQACQFCNLGALCRVDEMLQESDDD